MATIAAVTVALAQLLAIWHHTTVRHHWCAEHRDVCEDDVGTQPTAGTASSARDELATIGADRSSPAGERHGEGCALTGVTLTSTLNAAPRIDDVERALATSIDLRPAVASESSLGLLRIAPKTSPPQA